MQISGGLEVSKRHRPMLGCNSRVIVVKEAEVAHDLEIIILGVHRDLVIVHLMIIRVNVIIVGVMAPLLSGGPIADLNLHEQFHELLQTIFVGLALHGIFVD
jgi:hypothetical protein